MPSSSSCMHACLACFRGQTALVLGVPIDCGVGVCSGPAIIVFPSLIPCPANVYPGNSVGMGSPAVGLLCTLAIIPFPPLIPCPANGFHGPSSAAYSSHILHTSYPLPNKFRHIMRHWPAIHCDSCLPMHPALWLAMLMSLRGVGLNCVFWCGAVVWGCVSALVFRGVWGCVAC